MSSWAVGHNMVGYLPETDPAYFRTWKAARVFFEDAMREWADGEEEAWWQSASDNYSSEEEAMADCPSVAAHVGAIFAVDGIQLTPDQEAGVHVEDADGRLHAFWIMPVDESDVDEYVWDEED